MEYSKKLLHLEFFEGTSLTDEKTHGIFNLVMFPSIPRAKGVRWPSWPLEGVAACWDLREGDGGGRGGGEDRFLGLVLHNRTACSLDCSRGRVCDCSEIRWGSHKYFGIRNKL